jgi:hypothetical protein
LRARERNEKRDTADLKQMAGALPRRRNGTTSENKCHAEARPLSHRERASSLMTPDLIRGN